MRLLYLWLPEKRRQNYFAKIQRRNQTDFRIPNSQCQHRKLASKLTNANWRTQRRFPSNSCQCKGMWSVDLLATTYSSTEKKWCHKMGNEYLAWLSSFICVLLSHADPQEWQSPSWRSKVFSTLLLTKRDNMTMARGKIHQFKWSVGMVVYVEGSWRRCVFCDYIRFFI